MSLAVLFGLAGGLDAFGPLGIFLGPAIIALSLRCLKFIAVPTCATTLRKWMTVNPAPTRPAPPVVICRAARAARWFTPGRLASE